MRAPAIERFSLRCVGETWIGKWSDARLGVSVSGTADGPHPERAAMLCDLIDRWAEVSAGLEAFARAMLPDGLVQLQPPLDGCFAASSCGFDGALVYQSLSVTEDGTRITFYTGFPDGYATFEARLEAGHVVEITAYAS